MLKTWFSIIATLWVVVVCNGLSIDSSVWENTHYIRSIDLARSYVKETCLISAKNKDEVPQEEYYFRINDGFGAVPDISVISIILADQPIAIEPEKVGETVYKIKFPAPIAPNSVVDFKVYYVYIGSLHPLPARMQMDAVQSLLLRLNKFAYSEYLTKEYSLTFTGISKGQEMELHLVDENISENVPELKPRVEKKSLVYGPILEDIQPRTVQPMGLLYEHNRPLAKINNLNRSIWVPASDADKLSIEEYYELTNDAAALSSGFSRADWMKGRFDQTRSHWAISHLEIPLKDNLKFDDYYYTDLVGVVSTHQIAQNHLLLQPRFPIFGGWNYNFTLGWNNKLGDFLHRLHDEEDTYIAKVPLLNAIRDVTYENIYLTFYLPENAKFVNVSSPIEFESLTIDNELSYLDVSKGHVKVTLHYKNLFDELNKVDVLILYKYTKLNYWWKVLKISGFIFVGLASYYLLSLIEISIEKSKTNESE